MRSRSGFTLIELLVVIAIIAILAVVVVLTLNPSNLLAQSRDANRVNDMTNLNNALNLYVTDQASASNFSLGAGTTTYLSIPDSSLTCNNLGIPTGTYANHCTSTANLRFSSSTGWIPVNFASLSAGSPLSVLPIDPVNQTSSDLYYTYAISGTTYTVSSLMESQKYAKTMAATGGTDPGLYQAGSGVVTIPNTGRGLIGYWPLDEGTSTTATDYSASNAPGTWHGPQSGTNGYYSAGKVGPFAGYFNGASSSLDYVQTPSGIIPMSSPAAFSCTAWINPAATSATESAFITNSSIGSGQYCRILLANPGAGSLSSSFKDSLGNSYSVGSTGYTLPANTWVFVGTTWDGTTLTLYINGTLNNSATPGTAPPSGGTFYAVFGEGAGNGFYNGLLDDVRMYNRALSAAEIQEIYNAEK